jgi:hypothetical protein
MRNWVQHGAYHLDWQGDVLIAQYIGAWNEIAAKSMHQEAALLWTARNGKPWALLSDARTWEGGTSETFEAWWAFFADGVAHGLVCVTDILPSHFHALIVKDLADRSRQMATYKNSRDLPEAVQWLAEQGFCLT